MNLPTTILVLYPLIVLFMQAPPAGEAGNADASTDVWIHPAVTQSVQWLPPNPCRYNETASSLELLQEASERLPDEAATAEKPWLRAASSGPYAAPARDQQLDANRADLTVPDR